MNKTKNLLTRLSLLSGGVGIWAIAAFIVPILVAALFGVALSIKFDYWFEMAFSSALLVLIINAVLYFLTKQKINPHSEVDAQNLYIVEDDLVKASADWSQAELGVWHQTKQQIRTQLPSLEWNNMDAAALEVFALVATSYQRKPLDFTIPEALKLFEEVSCRYKLVVEAHLPAAEYLKISHLKFGADSLAKHGNTAKKVFNAVVWANRARNTLVNPASVVADITREKAVGNVFDNIQLAVKKTLLDEVAAVAIDLYSGRFSIETGSVECSKAAKQDELRIAPKLEPIRILLVGQTGSGKSSLINVLKNDFVAEVDILPSTDTTEVYHAVVDQQNVKLIDSQGLEGNTNTEQQILAEMIQADIILWVLKANQSARELDKALKQKFDHFYAQPENISRKRPRIISVLNQVDRLKPVNEWQPPYDLIKPTTAKANIILDALNYNHALLNPEVTLPLSIALNQPHFGVNILQQTLVESVNEAKNVQRNRQRMEAKEKGVSLAKQAKRSLNTVKTVLKAGVRLS